MAASRAQSKDRASELRLQRGADRGPVCIGDSRRSVSSPPGTCHTIRPDSHIELVCFNRYYLLTDEEYEAHKERFATWLGVENALLRQEIEAARSDFSQWGHDFMSWLSRIGMPEGGRPNGAMPALARRLEGLRLSSGWGREQLVEAGIGQAIVRLDWSRQRTQLGRYNERVLEQARANQQAVVWIKETAWQATHTGASILYALNPHAKMATRLGIAAAEGASSMLGTAIALRDAPSGGKAAWGAFRSDVQVRVPSILADYVMDVLVPAGSIAAGTRKVWVRALVGAVARMVVEFFFDFVMLSIDKGGKATFDDLLPLFESAAATAISEAVGVLLHVPADGSEVRKIARSVAVACTGTLLMECAEVVRAARNDKVSLADAWMARWPQVLGSLARAVALALFDALAHTRPTTRSPTRIEPTRPSPPDTDGARLSRRMKALRRIRAAFKTEAHPRHIAPVTMEEMHGPLAGVNMKRAFVNAFRRGAVNERRHVFVRLQNELSARHAGDPGKFFKPMTIQAKTSKDANDSSAGIALDPPMPERVDLKTGKEDPDFEKKSKKWLKDQGVMKAEGNLVRSDGRIVHPDMLEAAALTTQDKAAAREDAEVLRALQSKGDRLLKVDSIEKMVEHLPPAFERKRVERAFQRLQGADIGYISDFDLYGYFDASTGESIYLGNKKMTEAQEKRATQNVEAFNETYSPFKAGRDRKQAPIVLHGLHADERNPDGSFRFGDPGPLVAFLADGTLRIVTHDEVEAIVADYLHKYATHENAAVEFTTTAPPPPAPNNGETRRIAPRRIAPGQVVLPENDQEDGAVDFESTIDAMLVARGLFQLLPANSGFESRRMWHGENGIPAVQVAERLAVRIGASQDLKHLVFAAVAASTIGEALTRISQVVEATKPASGVEVHVEVYSRLQPRTAAGILGWFGENPGIDAKGQLEMADVLSAARGGSEGERRGEGPATRELHCFRAVRRVDAFQGTSRARIPALALDDVWIDEGHHLDFKPTKLLGQPVALFFDHALPIVAPAEVEHPGVRLADVELTTVRGVKQGLAVLGVYEGPLDDRYDDATEEAVSGFQANEGLPLVPVPDRATADHLREWLKRVLD